MARDSGRDIRNSVRRRAAELLSTPPSGSGITAYTIYGEVELRAAQSGTLTVARPSVFLVDRAIRPAEPSLPMIAVETITSSPPFELGRDGGLAFRSSLHCFGRQSNEASLLSYLMQKYWRPLDIYDYADPDSPVLRETALVDPNIEVSQGPTLADDLRQSGAFDHWFIVTFRGRIRDT